MEEIKKKSKWRIPLFIFLGVTLAFIINLAYASIFPSDNPMQFTIYEGEVEVSQMSLIAGLEMLDLNETKFHECVDLNVNASNSEFITLVYECMNGEGVKYAYYNISSLNVTGRWIASNCDKIQYKEWVCQNYTIFIE